MLSLGDFKPLSLEDKHIFHKHYSRYPPTHSGNLFTTMINWNHYAHYQYARKNDSIIIMHQIKDDIHFRLPSGPFNIDLIKQVLQLAYKEGSASSIGFVEIKQKDALLKEFPGLHLIEDRNSADYVYLASDLARLPGTKYAKIRNRLNQFKKKYAYSMEPLSKENMEETKEFLKRWCLWKDCESDELLENERKAIVFAMAHYFDLDLSGLALRINDRIEAISVFEQMNQDTAVVHFEKGSPDYDGVYKAINMETARFLQKTVTFIDREEDMGIAGLRQAKKSYNPHHMVEVFFLKKEHMHFEA